MKHYLIQFTRKFLLLFLIVTFAAGSAHAQSKQAEHLVVQAQSAFARQNYMQVIELCKRAIKISPRYARAYAWMGTAYGRRYIELNRHASTKKAALAQKKAAAAAFRKVLLLAPGTSDAKRAEQGLAKLANLAVPKLPKPQPDPTWKIAETRMVAKDGSEPYTSINAALTSAPANTRIIVKPGLYQESIVLTKPVQIIGDGDVSKIVVQSTDRPALQMSTSKALVKGISFDSQVFSNKEFHAVDIGMGRLVMEDCNIQSNSRAVVGIYNAGTNPTLRGCTISGASISAVVIYAGAGGQLDNCDISGAGFANVEIRQRANPLLTGCTLHDGVSKGLVTSNDGYGYLLDCTIANNGFAGVEVERGGQPTLLRCKITGNGTGLWMRAGSKVTLNQCYLTGNQNDSTHLEKGTHIVGSGNQI